MSEAKKVIIDPLVDNNPVTLQMLGICSALAVTTALLPALLMCVALTSVAALAGAIISALRHRIPNNIRIIVFMTIIASLVILVDQLLKAYAFETSKQLSVFVGLIITNCIVLGSAEAFAIKKPALGMSLLDGAWAMGSATVLSSCSLVAFIRELFGGRQVVRPPRFCHSSRRAAGTNPNGPHAACAERILPHRFDYLGESAAGSPSRSRQR